MYNTILSSRKSLYYYLVGNEFERLQDIFAQNLKEKREKIGYTQAQLAEKVGVSTHHIAMIEIARNNPTMELVERIAGVLDIGVYELFIAPLSPQKELEKLYETVAKNIEEVVSKAIEKVLSEKCNR